MVHEVDDVSNDLVLIPIIDGRVDGVQPFGDALCRQVHGRGVAAGHGTLARDDLLQRLRKEVLAELREDVVRGDGPRLGLTGA